MSAVLDPLDEAKAKLMVVLRMLDWPEVNRDRRFTSPLGELLGMIQDDAEALAKAAREDRELMKTATEAG